MCCPHAKSLRYAMRSCWPIPGEKELGLTGPEWLLNVINTSDPDAEAQLILILWRAWFVRNKWVHEGRWINGKTSAEFLSSYWDSLSVIRQGEANDSKGKRPMVDTTIRSVERKPKVSSTWTKPNAGWVKINVDGAFMEGSEDAGIGVVIRDSSGSVLLTAWKHVSDAGSAEEVEALACKEGLTLAAEWVTLPSILESDCANIVRFLSQPERQRSPSSFTIQEALEEAAKLPRVEFHHVGRELNSVAHSLAQLARRLNHSAVWPNRFPFCVEQLVARDVNPSIN